VQGMTDLHHNTRLSRSFIFEYCTLLAQPSNHHFTSSLGAATLNFVSSLALLPRPKKLFSSAFVCLFVCFRDYAKTITLIFTKCGGKMAHGPQK